MLVHFYPIFPKVWEVLENVHTVKSSCYKIHFIFLEYNFQNYSRNILDELFNLFYITMGNHYLKLVVCKSQCITIFYFKELLTGCYMKIKLTSKCCLQIYSYFLKIGYLSYNFKELLISSNHYLINKKLNLWIITYQLE